MVQSSIPQPLDAICMKAMATDPADRYLGAKALADDVERWLADEPVQAYRMTYLQRGGRWARRHKNGVRAAVITVIIIVALGALTRGYNEYMGRLRAAYVSRRGTVRSWRKFTRRFARFQGTPAVWRGCGVV